MLRGWLHKARRRCPTAPVALLLALAVMAITAAGGAAQQQRLTVKIDGFSADDWSRAQAVVTALEAGGRPASGLTKEAFQTRVNGSEVPVTEVTQGVDSSLPIAVVLALDVSGSMEGGALDQAKLAARSFLDALGADDSVAVLTFGDAVAIVQPFTEDRIAAGTAIDGLVAAGATALYQATADGVGLAAGAERGRRAVVLLSDGLDNGSRVTREEALSAAGAAGVPVFVIGLGDSIDRDYLRDLAEESGGQFAETPSPEGLAQLYQEVSELLRGQYVLTVDASALELDVAEAATLRVSVTSEAGAGANERLVCPQRLCVAITGLEPGERIEQARTVAAEIVSIDPVVAVTFLLDGRPLKTLTDPPFQVALDPDAYPGGEHSLAVEVKTSAGETQLSEAEVRLGVAASALGSSLLAIGAIGLVAVVAGLFLLFYVLKRRRRGPARGPEPAPQPEPRSPIPFHRARRRLRVLDEPPRRPAPQPDGPMGRLEATTGPLAGQSFQVGKSPVSIGSGSRCRVQLPQELEGGYEMPAEYARVWIRGDQLMVHELRRLTALGSIGGRWEILTDGDVFTIGPCTFCFKLGAEEERGPSEPVPNVLRDRPSKEPSGPPQAGPFDPAPDVLRSHPDERSSSDAERPPQAAAGA